jgi:hypothetical protein
MQQTETRGLAVRALLVSAAVLTVLPACEASGPVSRPLALTSPDGGSCGTVTHFGCCAGQTLRYCRDGTIVELPCGPGAVCGWSSAFGLYICASSEAEDPTGKVPRECTAQDAGPADAAMPGDASTGDFIADGEAEGGAAGSDSAVAQPDAGGSCGALTYTGCCEGAVLAYCSAGAMLTLSCASSETCGWNAARGFYDCETAGGADPSGTNPRSCSELFGDAGVMLPDASQGGDTGTPDLGGDASGSADGGSEGAPSSDAVAPADLPAGGTDRGSPRADGAADLRGLDAPGLEAPGLDVSRSDRSPPSEGLGCGSCAAAQLPGGSESLTLLALVPVLLVRGCRRRRAAG